MGVESQAETAEDKDRRLRESFLLVEFGVRSGLMKIRSHPETGSRGTKGPKQIDCLGKVLMLYLFVRFSTHRILGFLQVILCQLTPNSGSG